MEGAPAVFCGNAAVVKTLGRARNAGAKILCGGTRLDRAGWYLSQPCAKVRLRTRKSRAPSSFGSVTLLYRARDLDEAIALVNDSPVRLDVRDPHREPSPGHALLGEGAQAGVVVVNGGTHGSEPHMGFGGIKLSGIGWREAGVEALDVYSDWKVVNLISDPALT